MSSLCQCNYATLKFIFSCSFHGTTIGSDSKKRTKGLLLALVAVVVVVIQSKLVSVRCTHLQKPFMGFCSRGHNRRRWFWKHFFRHNFEFRSSFTILTSFFKPRYLFSNVRQCPTRDSRNKFWFVWISNFAALTWDTTKTVNSSQWLANRLR